MNATNYSIGDRVQTKKYGWGTIKGFEVMTGKTMCILDKTGNANSRIMVELDEPTLWPCYSETSGHPFFVQGDYTRDFI